MKIGIISENFYKYDLGGAELQIKFLVDFLIKNGHDVFYLCQGKKTILKPEIIDNQYKLYTIKKPFKNQNYLIYLQKNKIYQILDNEKPDILYQRGDFNFWDIISIYGRECNVKVVSGIASDIFTTKNKIPIFSLSVIKNYLLEKMKIKYYSYSDLIICQTVNQKENIKKNYHLDSIIIPNGHSIPNEPFMKSNVPTIIWISNIKPLKRPELFIRIAEKFRDYQYEFLMIGKPGRNKHHNKLMIHIKNINNIKYYGELPLDITNDYLSRSWIIINTSEYEGFSNTLIQAWLREVIVISMKHNPNYLLTKNKMGFLCKTEKDVIKVINFIINNNTHINIMKKKARLYAINNFNINDINNKYLKTFNDIIRNK